VAELDEIIRVLVERGGSDLHLSTARIPTIRHDGDICALEGLPAFTEAEVRQLLEEIMPERNRREFDERNDTDFAYEIADYVRLRVNAFRDRLGVGGVLRVIPTDVVPAEKLGLPKAVGEFCTLSKGLIVVTGPTGSGKSTTLAAMVDLINRSRSDHIITIEDPIEFVHREKRCLINQREVPTHTRSFASALRAALRQDPDIVLVGEMRDLETIEIAIGTAETGHLVLGTLHTNTAASTVDRVIDSFPADRQNQIRTMLANSLKGAVAQTLCKRKGGGRVAAMEVLVVDRAVAALIRDGKTYQIPSVMQVGGAKGMILLNDSLLRLVQGGIIDAEEAYLKSVEKDDLLTKFKRAGIASGHGVGEDKE
jgi:twitching motility protein PilT